MTRPEGAERLHAAARELLDELEGRYSVSREEFVDEGRRGVLLRPINGVADAFGVTFTETGLWTWTADRRGPHIPTGEESTRDCALRLQAVADAVVAGEYRWVRRPEGTLTFHTADEFLGLTEVEAHAWAGALGWTLRDFTRPAFHTDDLRYDRINVRFDDRGVVDWAKIS